MTICKYLCAFCLLLFIACKSDSKVDERSTPVPAQSTPAATPAPAANTQITPPAEPAQNSSGVWHFTCTKKCGGGAGAGGPCPDCGAPLEHNTAYHANGNTPSITPSVTAPSVSAPSVSAPSVSAPSIVPGPNGGQAIQVTPPAEPAQNSSGVWHFTCPNGCAGGGGSAAPCGSCGTTLAHNTSYHQ